jgi:hypothetical protein
MDEPALKVPDSEQERQQLLDELAADHGPHSAEQYDPGSLGCHELLDRTALAADIVERYVRTHPACVHNREWFALAEQAVAALQELYQRIGAAHLDDKQPRS